MTTELLLKRRWLTAKSTIGELWLDGAMRCYVLEDRYRPPPEKKVYGQTAIPCGRFGVIINHSPRFNRDLPLLLNVPGYEGVRIHPGNTADDTEGCLLPGRVRRPDQLLESRVAFEDLFVGLQMKLSLGPVFINVVLEPAP